MTPAGPTYVDFLCLRIGAYLVEEYVFLGMTKPSPHFASHQQHFERGPSTERYCFMYPFTKTHAWYQLPP